MITIEKLKDIEKVGYEPAEGLTYEQQVLRRTAHRLERLVIGDHVRRINGLFKQGGGFGTTVAIVDEHATVLWSSHPDRIEDLKLNIKAVDIKSESKQLNVKWVVDEEPDNIEFEMKVSKLQ